MASALLILSRLKAYAVKRFSPATRGTGASNCTYPGDVWSTSPCHTLTSEPLRNKRRSRAPLPDVCQRSAGTSFTSTHTVTVRESIAALDVAWLSAQANCTTG